MLRTIASAALAAILLAGPSSADPLTQNPVCSDPVWGQTCLELSQLPAGISTIAEAADHLKQTLTATSAERIIQVNGWVGASPSDVIPDGLKFRPV